MIGQIPYMFYLDGVPYSHTDSVTGVWLKNCITGERLLLLVLRKRQTCRCGCRGWCSYNAILESYARSFRAMANGEDPNSRHDDTAWLPSDGYRQGHAGRRWKFRAVVIRIMGDWMGKCITLGFPSWSSLIRPCRSQDHG